MCICAYMHAFTYVYKTKTQLSHVSGRGLPPTHMPHPLAPTLPLTCPPHPTAHAPNRSPLKQTPPGPPQVDPAPSHPQPSAGRLGNPARARKRRAFSSLWECSSITFEPVTAHAPITIPRVSSWEVSWGAVRGMANACDGYWHGQVGLKERAA